MKQYNVAGTNGFDSLVYRDDVPIPEVESYDVLVKIEGVSLNYRDLIITKGKYPFSVVPSVVPGSDGAGVVQSVGSKVTRFKRGDRVLTLFNQAHYGGDMSEHIMASGLGGALPGVMREYATFNEAGLVLAPRNLSMLEAATLPCAALTAWNALYGLTGKTLKAGDTVLVEGTGGVSLFGLQFAKANGATVIATTSDDAKVEKLKQLGADHVLNYKTTPNWGEEAKKLTGGRGVDHIIEVGGPGTMKQSFKAIRIDGVITIVGFLGGMKGDQPSFLECLTNICTVRGVLVGSRVQLEDMVRAIEANPQILKPVIDKEVFPFERAKDAYQYMWDRKHFGKVCIKMES